MKPAAARAFDLQEEPAKLRDRYGRNRFGQACLLGPTAGGTRGAVRRSDLRRLGHALQ